MATRQQAIQGSSAISFASYDDDTQELTLSFTNGGNYIYPAVPAEIYEGLISAASAGRYYHMYIKDRF